MIKRIERGADAGPDRRSAGGGQLLAADDRSQARKTGVAPPQRRHARELKYGPQPRVLLDQRVDGIFEVGLGVEVEGHCRVSGTFCSASCRACPGYPRLLSLRMMRPSVEIDAGIHDLILTCFSSGTVARRGWPGQA